MMYKIILFTMVATGSVFNASAQEAIKYPSYKGLLMCGYQGWFKAPGDPSGSRTWWHYGSKGKFDPNHLTIDMWPDMNEYDVTYETDFLDERGEKMDIFSSIDYETSDLHFKWMKEYGIDGVFMQRFYYYVADKEVRGVHNNMVLSNALKASGKHGRAIALMYDLSGLGKDADNLDDVVEDWKFLIDEIGLLDNKEHYLHHNGKPLVAIWGLGFNGRPYDIEKIQVDKFIDFLKNDPEYGGMAIMLGVPTWFRTLNNDCTDNPFLHDLIRKADVVQPWHVGRFHMNDIKDPTIYSELITGDLEWCRDNGVDYVPTVYPGFSWHNLRNGKTKLNEKPRLKGAFMQAQIDESIAAGVEMIYVAMFDEVDEGTAIFKVTNRPPVNATFSDYEGLPSDHYLKLAGKAANRLKSLKN